MVELSVRGRIREALEGWEHAQGNRGVRIPTGLLDRLEELVNMLLDEHDERTVDARDRAWQDGFDAGAATEDTEFSKA